MLWAILNKSRRQHPTKHQLYSHLPPITKTIQVRRTRHAGHCWRSRDELISDVLLWTPTYGRAKAGRQARTYIQQLCEDTGCSPEDLPEAMNNREKWRERVRDIRAGGTTWWWGWWFFLTTCSTFSFFWWELVVIFSSHLCLRQLFEHPATLQLPFQKKMYSSLMWTYEYCLLIFKISHIFYVRC